MTPPPLHENAERALGAWDLGGGRPVLDPVDEGHINRSWTITVAGPGAALGVRPAAPGHLLQLVSADVFPNPEHVIENVAAVTAHLGRAVRATGLSSPERRTLTLVPTRAGRPWHRDPDGAVWRLYPFIGGTTVREHVTTALEAREVGRAFGTFQRLLADYHGSRLHETIPRFHDTAWRVAALEAAATADCMARLARCRREVEVLLVRRAIADVLPALLASGAVPERIAHNDAKSSNVLLDAQTGEALCVVDLDTVMPGTALADFGDMVRSATSPTAEDEPDTSRVAVRPELFAGLVEGYLAEAGATLTAAEREHLVFAGQLITYEQAVRFLADHLEGDRYYRVARPGHNLVRARAQIALLESIEGNEGALGNVVRDVMGRG